MTKTFSCFLALLLWWLPLYGHAQHLTKHVSTPVEIAAEIAAAAEQQRRMERAVLAVLGTQYAFWLQSDQQRLSKLRAVAFYVGPNGFPKQPFRVRIYRPDGPLGAPSTDLLTDNVLYSYNKPEKESAWYWLDLRDYAIVPPPGGCFVAVEYCCSDRFTSSEMVEDYAPTGSLLTAPADVQNQHVWLYLPNKGWKDLSATKATLTKFNALVKVEME